MKMIFSIRPARLNAIFLFVRIGIGTLMLVHGIPKFANLISEEPVNFMDFIGLGPEISLGLAVFAEVICSILIIIGLGTRLVVIPLIITMLVAVFIAHGDDPFSRQELGLHYLLVYVMLLFTGSGKYSVDQILSK